MSRIEWVKQRLDNWARWHQQRESGSLGYPKQSAFVRLAAHGTRAGNVIPIDDVEASVTDDAVKALQFTHSHLHVTICCLYLEGIGVDAAAVRMRRARSTVLGHLAQADQALAIWFRARADRREKSFTS
jgi:hypothetical protein